MDQKVRRTKDEINKEIKNKTKDPSVYVGEVADSIQRAQLEVLIDIREDTHSMAESQRKWDERAEAEHQGKLPPR